MPASCAHAGAAANRNVTTKPNQTRFALGIRLLEMLRTLGPTLLSRGKSRERYDTRRMMERTLHVKRPEFKKEYGGQCIEQEPGPRGSPHDPQTPLSIRESVLEPVLTAKTDSCFSRASPWQAGQAG
jgi:hypothetical protein